MRIDMHDIRRAAERNGSHWFDPSSMRFFRSRVAQMGYQAPQSTVAYFVSSEQFVASNGYRAARRYTVRYCNLATGQIGDIGKFQAYASRSGADRAARRYAELGEQVTA